MFLKIEDFENGAFTAKPFINSFATRYATAIGVFTTHIVLDDVKNMAHINQMMHHYIRLLIDQKERPEDKELLEEEKQSIKASLIRYLELDDV